MELSHDAQAEVWSETPPHAAARLGDAAALDAAVPASAEIEALETLGFIPLHVAAIEGRPDIVSPLLAAGAAVDAWAKERFHAADSACAQARVEVVERLLAAGADLCRRGQEPDLRRVRTQGTVAVHPEVSPLSKPSEKIISGTSLTARTKSACVAEDTGNQFPPPLLLL